MNLKNHFKYRKLNVQNKKTNETVEIITITKSSALNHLVAYIIKI